MSRDEKRIVPDAGRVRKKRKPVRGQEGIGWVVNHGGGMCQLFLSL